MATCPPNEWPTTTISSPLFADVRTSSPLKDEPVKRKLNLLFLVVALFLVGGTAIAEPRERKEAKPKATAAGTQVLEPANNAEDSDSGRDADRAAKRWCRP